MDFGSAVGRASGFSSEEIAAVKAFGDLSGLEPIERDVVEYAERMSVTPVDVPDDLYGRLHEAFGEKGMVEITATVAWENFVSRFNRALMIESQGFSDAEGSGTPP